MRLAQECGAEQTVDAGEEDIVECVLDSTDGVGADSTIVTVGGRTMLGDAISLTKRGKGAGGDVPLAGFPHLGPSR